MEGKSSWIPHPSPSFGAISKTPNVWNYSIIYALQKLIKKSKPCNTLQWSLLFLGSTFLNKVYFLPVKACSYGHMSEQPVCNSLEVASIFFFPSRVYTLASLLFLWFSRLASAPPSAQNTLPPDLHVTHFCSDASLLISPALTFWLENCFLVPHMHPCSCCPFIFLVSSV